MEQYIREYSIENFDFYDLTAIVKKKWVFEWEKLNFKKKKNPDLWKRFLIIYRKHNVTFTWIKGHNNHPENERCDYMANKAARSSNLIKDTYYEQNIKRS